MILTGICDLNIKPNLEYNVFGLQQSLVSCGALLHLSEWITVVLHLHKFALATLGLQKPGIMAGTGSDIQPKFQSRLMIDHCHLASRQ